MNHLVNYIQFSLLTYCLFIGWCGDHSLLTMLEADTKEYYAKLSQEFIKSNTTATYVLFATEQLSKETSRTKYLWSSNPAAIEIILRVIELELIENHKAELQEEFERILKSERTADVNVLFRLLGKNEGTALALQRSLNRLILKEFDDSYSSLQSSQEILVHVLKVYQKNVAFIESAFDNDSKMIATLEDSMAQIINQKIKKSWLLFSNFIDEMLKKKLPLSKDVLGILKLFSARSESFDDFINEFKEKLAERSIFNDLEVEVEESVLAMFNDKLSPEHYNHVKRMLQDYKEKRESVLVLTSHAWPINCNPQNFDSESVPDSLKNLMKSFEVEYCKVHCGRRLQWCPQLITLQAENGTVMTLLQYQIINLLPLSTEKLTEAAQKLDVSLKEFTVALKILQEFEVVKYEISSNQFEFLALPENLNLVPIKGISDEIESVVLNQIVGDSGKLSLEIDSTRQARQSFILQSLISLILKKQRQASPAELKKLITSSAGKLKNDHSFTPSLEDIDAAVNSLIGKGYVEFNETENLFIYVP